MSDFIEKMYELIFLLGAITQDSEDYIYQLQCILDKMEESISIYRNDLNK